MDAHNAPSGSITPRPNGPMPLELWVSNPVILPWLRFTFHQPGRQSKCIQVHHFSQRSEGDFNRSLICVYFWTLTKPNQTLNSHWKASISGISTEATGRTVLIFPQAGGLAREEMKVGSFWGVGLVPSCMFTVNICLEIRHIIGRHTCFRKLTEVLPTTKFSTHLDPMSYSRSKKLNKRGINKTYIVIEPLSAYRTSVKWLFQALRRNSQCWNSQKALTESPDRVYSLLFQDVPGVFGWIPVRVW